jgi:hypothetical protein
MQLLTFCISNIYLIHYAKKKNFVLYNVHLMNGLAPQNLNNDTTTILHLTRHNIIAYTNTMLTHITPVGVFIHD